MNKRVSLRQQFIEPLEHTIESFFIFRNETEIGATFLQPYDFRSERL